MEPLTPPTLLAQLPQAPIHALQQAFESQGHSTADLMWIATAIGVIALLLVVLQVLTRSHEPRQPQRQTHLKRAVRAVGLRRAERRLVRRLAEQGELAEPVAMLLAPGCLADALRRATVGAPDADLEAATGDLCRHLFDVPLPTRQPNRPLR